MPNVYDQVPHKIPGLINLGNTCYMNSIMQCLNCATPQGKYFTGDAYREDMNSLSIYGGTVAREVGAALVAMKNFKKGFLSHFRP